MFISDFMYKFIHGYGFYQCCHIDSSSIIEFDTDICVIIGYRYINTYQVICRLLRNKCDSK